MFPGFPHPKLFLILNPKIYFSRFLSENHMFPFFFHFLLLLLEHSEQ